MNKIKVSKIKIYFKTNVKKITKKINDCFSMKNSINNLNKFVKKFYLCSIGFDEIYFGMKNSKRFVITILSCIMIWMATLYHLLLIVSDDLWSTIDGPFLPENFRIFMLIFSVFFLFASVVKTQFLITEINYPSAKSPFKIFYFLMVDLKTKHKLNEINYKKLSFISRMIQIIMIDYEAPICLIFVILICIKILVSSEFEFKWFFHSVLIFSTFGFMGFTLSIIYCCVIIYFLYYKLKFDQINNRFKQLSFGKIITKAKEKQIIQLIHEHNQISIEIHRMNLSFRLSTAVLFIAFAKSKIISMYLIVNSKHNLIIFLMGNLFFIFFFLGSALSYLFSKQINSSRQSYKFIQTIFCKYKMKFKFQLKVNQLNNENL